MFDLYETITTKVIKQMESGIIPWSRPWVGLDRAVSHTSGKAYSLLNQLLLGKEGEYITFNQVNKENGSVLKGEKSSIIVYWDLKEYIDAESGEVKKIPFLRYYNVFHLEQTSGITAKYDKEEAENPAASIETADEIIKEYIIKNGITVNQQHSGKAYYSPSDNSITMPNRQQFSDSAKYYSTFFHEMAHSTMKALNRQTKSAFFGNTEYSEEELVAELTAAALLHHCGIDTESSFTNSTAYIQNWLAALRNDKKLLVSASSKAEKAAAYILGTN